MTRMEQIHLALSSKLLPTLHRDTGIKIVVSESTVIAIAGSVKNGRHRHKPVGFTKFFWEISFFLSQKPPLICFISKNKNHRR